MATPLASVAVKATFWEAVEFVSGVAGVTVTAGAVWSTTIVRVCVVTLPALSVTWT